MGTMLQSKGLTQGQAPEEWNLERPEEVAAVHRAYIEAGSDAIQTNSFGGNRIRLSLHGWDDRAEAVNRAAAEIARRVAGEEIAVGGSIGPTGSVLEPYGELTFAEAKEAFAEQVRALAAGGVDYFIVETMSDLEEMRAAIEAVRENSDLPAMCTMTFDTRLHTMMGVSPSQAAVRLHELGADLIGANCGNGPEEIEVVIRQMKETVPDANLAAQANAGVPRLVGDRTVFDASPEAMADYARRMRDLGVKYIGACCGNTPAHIRAMARALRS
jgi:5-methyltetrahydrofolate--homocysteine methyltransferase